MTNKSWLPYLAKFLRPSSSTHKSDPLSIKKADIVVEALELNTKAALDLDNLKKPTIHGWTGLWECWEYNVDVYQIFVEFEKACNRGDLES